DLRRFDADHAVVVPAETGDAVSQLECRSGAAAPDDLEYVIHRGFVPIEYSDGSAVVAEEMGDLPSRLSSGGLRRKWKDSAVRSWRACRWTGLLAKTACNPR